MLAAVQLIDSLLSPSSDASWALLSAAPASCCSALLHWAPASCSGPSTDTLFRAAHSGLALWNNLSKRPGALFPPLAPHPEGQQAVASHTLPKPHPLWPTQDPIAWVLSPYIRVQESTPASQVQTLQPFQQ